MAKVIKVSFFIVSSFCIAVLLYMGFMFGFSNTLKLPAQIYIMRIRDFESAEKLVDKWGLQKFNTNDWKMGNQRAPQALDLFFSNRLIGKKKTEIEKDLGPSDGDYAGSESNLSYTLFKHIIDFNGIEVGARWSLIIVFKEETFATQSNP